MLVIESKWIGDLLQGFGKTSRELKLLNVGSSTLEFRTLIQPYIEKNVFQKLPLNLKVVHLDMKEEEGVDMVGNLMDENFLQSIQEKFDMVLCSNLLEHVEEPQKVIDRLEQIIPVGGHIIVTGPYRFPYHNDPIDTKFRPSVKKLASMFSRSVLIEGQIITEEDSHFKMLARKPKLALLTLARLATPFYKPKSWLSQVKDVPNLFKPFQVVAVLLKKQK